MQCNKPRESKQPNILIFMSDQQMAQVIETNHPCLTPNIGKFCREGLRFTSAYTPMAHCSPSRASFMTGLYPSQHGIYNNVLNDQAIHASLKEGSETFSEKLKESGYDLYYTGKWHVSASQNPSDFGWEELFVTCKALSENQAPDSARTKYEKSMLGREEDVERKRGEVLRPGWGKYRLYGIDTGGGKTQEDSCIMQAGLEKLSSLGENSNPWCLYIGVNAPHDPFVLPEKYARMYDSEEIKLPPNYLDEFKNKPAIYRRMRKLWDQLSEDEVRESIAHYWGFCTMVDDMFGSVLDTLDQIGQKDNTMVLFLSDHGEHCGAHGLYCKGISAFNEGYHVPLAMRWPKGIKNPGRVVDPFVSLMDIAPTLIQAVQANELSKCSGRSLMPFIQDEEPQSWRNSIYTQCNGVELFYTQRTVRTKKYKFVYTPIDVDELYDLEKDPYEMNNIIDEPHMRDVKKEMYKLMWENAFESEDTVFCPYITVSTAEYGPGVVFDG